MRINNHGETDARTDGEYKQESWLIMPLQDTDQVRNQGMGQRDKPGSPARSESL